ncbi:MAG: PqqD family protein [Armatimonadota bacterium]
MKQEKAVTTDWSRIKVMRNPQFSWKENEEGLVDIEKTRDSFIDKLCQKYLKTPRATFIHLDELGSFFWKHADGDLTVSEIAQKMEEEFKEKAKDSVPRATRFAVQLHRAKFVHFMVAKSEKERGYNGN